MIDMSSLYEHEDYPSALKRFEKSCALRRWRVFKQVHVKVSKEKCPICECPLEGSFTRPSTTRPDMPLEPTIDHYRPKDDDLYPLLKYDDKNYLLMCSDCNSAYKGNLFPLYNSERERTVEKTENIKNEKPLIVNPIYDNLLDLFELAFRYTESGKKVLELVPKHADGYLHEKAKETIRLFSLGDCEDESYTHTNQNVKNGRISLLGDHFNKFYPFIKALQAKDKKAAFLEYKKHNLGSYGFYEFIKNNQFKDLTSSSSS